MALTCVIISESTEVPERVAQFLEQARFFEVYAMVSSPEAAIGVLAVAAVPYLIVELRMAEPMLSVLRRLPLADRPRLIILGHEESYFLDRGAAEPVLFKPESFLPSVRENCETSDIPFVRPIGKVQVPAQWIEMFGAIALETKPVWLLMEPGQWSFEPATAVSELLYVRTDQGIKRLRRNDLLLIEAQKDYLKLTARETNFRVLRSMKSIEARLDVNMHCRVHRSYIVLLEAVHSIDQDVLWLDGLKEAVPIGPNYRKDLLARLNII
jgi:hypothetical protein